MFYRLGSIFLVLLFISIQAIQAFHTHKDVITLKGSEKTECVASAEICKVCDYYAHKMGKEMHLTYPPIVNVPMPKAIVLGDKIFARIYKFTLQGFTNKGPPATFC